MITKRDDASRGLTREELLALPAAVDLETAHRALSLSRTTGYDLAKRGRYRVVTADLLKRLHIEDRERPERAQCPHPQDAQRGTRRQPMIWAPLAGVFKESLP